MKKNTTLGILIILALASLLATIASFYFALNPSCYTPPIFDPFSLQSWSLIIFPAFMTVCLLYSARKAKDRYAKIFWFLATIFIYGILKDCIFQGAGELPQVVSVLESIIPFCIILIFLFKYQKHKFDLFDGLKKDKT